MREILFRGQTRKRGEKVQLDGTLVPGNWVYGGLAVHGTHESAHSLICETETCKKIPVYADTVGQFTGVTDKNGRRIYEGDIVMMFGTPYVVRFAVDVGWFVAVRPDSHRTLNTPICEVVGNIYDDPELMEGDKT